jgi:hypothetical protein
MTKVLDDAAIERAMRAAERALASGDPDTLAARFRPKLVAQGETKPARQHKVARRRRYD